MTNWILVNQTKTNHILTSTPGKMPATCVIIFSIWQCESQPVCDWSCKMPLLLWTWNCHIILWQSFRALLHVNSDSQFWLDNHHTVNCLSWQRIFCWLLPSGVCEETVYTACVASWQQGKMEPPCLLLAVVVLGEMSSCLNFGNLKTLEYLQLY